MNYLKEVKLENILINFKQLQLILVMLIQKLLTQIDTLIIRMMDYQVIILIFLINQIIKIQNQIHMEITYI